MNPDYKWWVRDEPGFECYDYAQTQISSGGWNHGGRGICLYRRIPSVEGLFSVQIRTTIRDDVTWSMPKVLPTSDIKVAKALALLFL